MVTDRVCLDGSMAFETGSFDSRLAALGTVYDLLQL